jgi:hypothetical protein
MVSLIGVRATLISAGVLGAVVTFAFLFLPGMRIPEDRPRAHRAGRHRADRLVGVEVSA